MLFNQYDWPLTSHYKKKNSEAHPIQYFCSLKSLALKVRFSYKNSFAASVVLFLSLKNVA